MKVYVLMNVFDIDIIGIYSTKENAIEAAKDFIDTFNFTEEEKQSYYNSLKEDDYIEELCSIYCYTLDV